MFINLSNHPVATWTKEQVDAAKEYGEIVDLPFPNVPPCCTEDELLALAHHYLMKVKELVPVPEEHSAVHLTGEPVFVYVMATLLNREGYMVLSSTTRHNPTYVGNAKVTVFHFECYRKYPLIK